MSLGVLMFTYEGINADRTEYATRTIRRLRQNLVWPGEVVWHIADDGSHPRHVEAITEAARTVEDAIAPITHWTTSNSRRKGYGANVNLGHQQIREHPDLDAILCIEDDWELQKPLDPSPMIQMFSEHTTVGMVRLSYIAHTRDLIGQFIATQDNHQWLALRRDLSTEGFIFCGHPRLEHPQFSLGFKWAEEKLWRPGDHELDAAYRLYLRDAGERTEVVWPVDFSPASPSAQNYFGHIGERASFNA